MIFCEKKSFAQKSDGHEEKDLKKMFLLQYIDQIWLSWYLSEKFLIRFSIILIILVFSEHLNSHTISILDSITWYNNDNYHRTTIYRRLKRSIYNNMKKKKNLIAMKVLHTVEIKRSLEFDCFLSFR